MVFLIFLFGFCLFSGNFYRLFRRFLVGRS